MKKTTSLCLAAAAALLSSTVAFAQMPTHTQYVKYWGEGERFSTMYRAWQAGSAMSNVYPDDEEFFISRVRPRERFVEPSTQVNPALTSGRKLLWWVPLGVPQWNAIPSYYFNSEVFSTWSYIDHWGNWTAPYLRLPAAFADVAHKNGVSVSATAPVAWSATVDLATNNDGAGGNFKAVVDGGPEKYINYLRYYGIDGAGYNSEFNFRYESQSNSFEDFLSKASVKAKEKGLNLYSNVWYSLTGNAGQIISGGSWDRLDSSNNEYFHKNGKTVSTHFFLNYNWGGSDLPSSVEMAESLGRNSYDVYAGWNMQKGSGESWQLLERNKVSVGVWGAHSANMLYENRGGAGSSPMAQQVGYQRTSENFFTGGKRNPLLAGEVAGSSMPSGYQSTEGFFGISKIVAERSALQSTDIAKDPFVTYFNLGNGRFFNLEGETKMAGEWYNLGMQDHMPTWRWWFSKSFMGRGADQAPANSLKAEFTWEDAWFGGSCLQISGGTTAKQYLQLFQTKYPVQAGDKITVRYKVVRGTGTIGLSAGVIGSDAEAQVAVTGSSAPEYGEWVAQEITIGSGLGAGILRIPGGSTLGVLGLNFTNTSSDFIVRIGEISLTRVQAITPKAPTITKHVHLENSHKGFDFKLIYSMAPLKTTREVTYNDEVDTWYYEIYSQQKGEDEQFCTATTSWAAYMVNAKINIEGSRQVRYGVRAVSLDGKTKSPITWTNYEDLRPATEDNNVSADYTTVNPNEKVTVSFDDPKHAAATKWEFKRNGQVVSTVSGGTSATAQFTEAGSYDLEYTLANGTVMKRPAFISVVPEAAGTSPRILKLTANGQEGGALTIYTSDKANMAYTSNDADGAVSRALRIEDKTFKIKDIYNTLGVRLGNGLMTGEGGMTVTFWLRPMKTVFARSEDGVRIFDISKPREVWPMSEWSYFWVNYGGGWDPKGSARDSRPSFQWTNMSTGYNNMDAREKFVDTDLVPLEAGAWYHIAITIGYNLSTKLYVNGALVAERAGSSTRTSTFGGGWDLNISRYAKFAYALDGFIDEVRVYNRALADSEIPATKDHLDNPTDPNLKAYFDFEAPVGADGAIINRVGSTHAYLQSLDWLGEGKQQWTNVPVVPFGPSNGWVAGDSYKITTAPTWEAKKGVFTDQQHTATAGSAKVAWANKGAYPVTLTLDNPWGSSTKTYNSITVEATGAEVTEIIDLTVFPNPFVEDVLVRFADGGAYSVAVYDLSGALITRQALNVAAGEEARFDLNAPSGIYLMRIATADGKLLRTIKLQKK